ncbi:hypothetical protein NDU88_007249 [Pleurodeles waltl]|uniref:Uncharacterized protein n=1 Tax=Pleurodeles waltl TaxID=8319 RepID=A0AAV7MEP4_PLEWA|nr:hypothetical protein NDU88_007249 [Pleurodeles waltl]
MGRAVPEVPLECLSGSVGQEPLGAGGDAAPGIAPRGYSRDAAALRTCISTCPGVVSAGQRRPAGSRAGR